MAVTIEEIQNIIHKKQNNIIVSNDVYRELLSQMSGIVLSPHIKKEHFMCEGHAVINGGWREKDAYRKPGAVNANAHKLSRAGSGTVSSARRRTRILPSMR